MVTALGIAFLALIGFAGWQLYRQNRLTYLQLDDRQRALLLGALGAIVLMIAGADELTETGLGLVVWLAVLACLDRGHRPGLDRDALELLTRPAAAR